MCRIIKDFCPATITKKLIFFWKDCLVMTETYTGYMGRTLYQVSYRGAPYKQVFNMKCDKRKGNEC